MAAVSPDMQQICWPVTYGPSCDSAPTPERRWWPRDNSQAWQMLAEDWNFLAVVYPQPPGGEIPAIDRIDDYTVRVGDDVICFAMNSCAVGEAELLVDPDAFVQRGRDTPKESCRLPPSSYFTSMPAAFRSASTRGLIR
ncbi:MAG: hypothetical protein R6U98_07390 [Pirellulaceae bacterium]